MKVLVTNEELCIGCHLCEDVCSQAWYKEIDGKSAIRITSLGDAEWGMAVCSQCGDCIDVCPTGALYRDKAGIVRLKKERLRWLPVLRWVLPHPDHVLPRRPCRTDQVHLVRPVHKQCPTDAITIEVLPG